MTKIELLLEAAKRYGLEIEVEETANQIIKENPEIDHVTAYVLALQDWDILDF